MISVHSTPPTNRSQTVKKVVSFRDQSATAPRQEPPAAVALRIACGLMVVGIPQSVGKYIENLPEKLGDRQKVNCPKGKRGHPGVRRALPSSRRHGFLTRWNIGNIVITTTDIVQFLHHMYLQQDPNILLKIEKDDTWL